jgi:nicotinic acid phosphoribosyltransferase
MAHSLVMAISAIEGSEQAAFRAFHRYFPGAPLPIDTYDQIVAATELAKQIAAGDTLGLATEGEGLLQLVMSRGDRLQPDDSLVTIRQRADANVASLTADLRDINYDKLAPVNIFPSLLELTQSLKEKA